MAVQFLGRFLALFLTLTQTLSGSAFALRQAGLEENAAKQEFLNRIGVSHRNRDDTRIAQLPIAQPTIRVPSPNFATGLEENSLHEKLRRTIVFWNGVEDVLGDLQSHQEDAQMDAIATIVNLHRARLFRAEGPLNEPLKNQIVSVLERIIFKPYFWQFKPRLVRLTRALMVGGLIPKPAGEKLLRRADRIYTQQPQRPAVEEKQETSDPALKRQRRIEKLTNLSYSAKLLGRLSSWVHGHRFYGGAKDPDANSQVWDYSVLLQNFATELISSKDPIALSEIEKHALLINMGSLLIVNTHPQGPTDVGVRDKVFYGLWVLLDKGVLSKEDLDWEKVFDRQRIYDTLHATWTAGRRDYSAKELDMELMHLHMDDGGGRHGGFVIKGNRWMDPLDLSNGVIGDLLSREESVVSGHDPSRRKNTIQTVASLIKKGLIDPASFDGGTYINDFGREDGNFRFREIRSEQLDGIVRAGLATPSDLIATDLSELCEKTLTENLLLSRKARWFLLVKLLGTDERFHEWLTQPGTTFQAAFGFPEGVGRGALDRFGLAWIGIQREASYKDVSLGGRAALRWKLLLAARQSSAENLQALGQTWLTHLVRLEALDEALGLPTVGAEIHTDSSNAREREMTPVVLNLASGVGPHAMEPVHPEGESLLDFRLLPGYPTTFALLLHQFLGASRVKGIPAVGAHYSVGVDLGKNLVPLSLALFYGDPHHAWPPKARGEADQGFPGIDTYRGEMLNFRSGRKEYRATQSNIHLRPLKIVRDRGLGLEPEALFPMDLEAVAWLSVGAMAPKGSDAAQVFQTFLQEWTNWLNGLGGKDLVQKVAAAKAAISRESGAGLSDTLDQASADIYEKLHGISSEEAWERMDRGDPSVEQLQKRGFSKRNELALLLDRTLKGIQETSFVDPEVRESLQAYRAVMIEGKDLAELDSRYANVVEVLSQAVFRVDRGSEKEAKLLKLFEALAPDQAGNIRTALNKPKASEAGLEERFNSPDIQRLFEDARRLPSRRRLEEDANTHLLSPMDRSDGVRIRGILESHGDPLVLDMLHQTMSEFMGENDIKPAEWLFIIEGGERRLGTPSEVMDAGRVAIQVADRLGIAVINPIRNASQWEVVEEMIRRGADEAPSITREDVLGFLVAWLAEEMPSGIVMNTPRAIQVLHSKWQGKATILELYPASEAMMDREAHQREFMRLSQIIDDLQGTTSGEPINLGEWDVVEKIIQTGRTPGPTLFFEEGSVQLPQLERQQVLGLLVNQFAAQNFRGKIPDIPGAIQRALAGWGNRTSIEEIHNALFSERLQSVDRGQRRLQMQGLLTAVQDDLTRQAVREELAQAPKTVRNVFVLAGFNHEGSITSALTSGMEGISIADFVGNGKYAAGVPESQRDRAQTLLNNGAVTIAAGVVRDTFQLVTDSDLVAAADGSLKKSPIEGVQFTISGKLRTEQNFQGQGLIIPSRDQGPFKRPGISLRILDPISEQQMHALTPLAWIALNLDRNLTVDQVLNLHLFFLTSRDEQGRTIHAVFA